MTARTTLKIDSRNVGGIAKDQPGGNYFHLRYVKDGEIVDDIHYDADESVPALRRRLGLTPDQMMCTRLLKPPTT